MKARKHFVGHKAPEKIKKKNYRKNILINIMVINRIWLQKNPTRFKFSLLKAVNILFVKISQLKLKVYIKFL